MELKNVNAQLIEQLIKQLKIANGLKAWELKIKYKELGLPVHPTNAEQIDKILEET